MVIMADVAGHNLLEVTRLESLLVHMDSISITRLSSRLLILTVGTVSPSAVWYTK